MLRSRRARYRERPHDRRGDRAERIGWAAVHEVKLAELDIQLPGPFLPHDPLDAMDRVLTVTLVGGW
jgi:hypothetical protein